MTAIAKRKSRLTFETSAEVRYRGKMRPIVVEVDSQGFTAKVRLKGTRVAYDASWVTIYTDSAIRFADRVRREKKEARKLRRKP